MERLIRRHGPLTTLANLTMAPPLPFLPEDVHSTRIVVIDGMHASAIETEEVAVRPLRTLGTRLEAPRNPRHTVKPLLDPNTVPTREAVPGGPGPLNFIP